MEAWRAGVRAANITAAGVWWVSPLLRRRGGVASAGPLAGGGVRCQASCRRRRWLLAGVRAVAALRCGASGGRRASDKAGRRVAAQRAWSAGKRRRRAAGVGRRSAGQRRRAALSASASGGRRAANIVAAILRAGPAVAGQISVAAIISLRRPGVAVFHILLSSKPAKPAGGGPVGHIVTVKPGRSASSAARKPAAGVISHIS